MSGPRPSKRRSFLISGSFTPKLMSDFLSIAVTASAVRAAGTRAPARAMTRGAVVSPPVAAAPPPAAPPTVVGVVAVVAGPYPPSAVVRR